MLGGQRVSGGDAREEGRARMSSINTYHQSIQWILFQPKALYKGLASEVAGKASKSGECE